jgi:hypothetical protein
VADPEDIVELRGVRANRDPATPIRSSTQPGDSKSAGKFLSIWFRCCNVYGRIYRNAAQTAYEGRCPKCGAAVHASIGPGGTNRRSFEAR